MDDSPAQQNFTIAHELGHYVLKHHESAEFKDNYSVLLRNTGDTPESPMECEANWFAENLLIPADFLRERVEKYPFITTQQLARMFGAPTKMVADRRQYLNG